MAEQVNKYQFAQSVKEKYPQYKDVDDVELANAMIEKYPQYKSQVRDATPEEQLDYEGIDPETMEKKPPELTGKQKLKIGALRAAQFAGGLIPQVPGTPIDVSSFTTTPWAEYKIAKIKGKTDKEAALDAAIGGAIDLGVGAAIPVGSTLAIPLVKKIIGKETLEKVFKSGGKKGVANLIKKNKKLIAKQARKTGLEEETVKRLAKNPELAKKATKETLSIGDDIAGALAKQEDSVKSAYKTAMRKVKAPKGKAIDTNWATNFMSKRDIDPTDIRGILQAGRKRELVKLSDAAIDRFLKGKKIGFQEAKKINSILADATGYGSKEVGLGGGAVAKLGGLKKLLVRKMDEVAPGIKRANMDYAKGVKLNQSIKKKLFDKSGAPKVSSIDSLAKEYAGKKSKSKLSKELVELQTKTNKPIVSELKDKAAQIDYANVLKRWKKTGQISQFEGALGLGGTLLAGGIGPSALLPAAAYSGVRRLRRAAADPRQVLDATQKLFRKEAAKGKAIKQIPQAIKSGAKVGALKGIIPWADKMREQQRGKISIQDLIKQQQERKALQGGDVA